ncbi:OPT family oligopeptide transporter [Clostridium hydrogeniformans]|uniref:OPT family oligopeptide transporter n=1 Tax=Clostridium hydrogeniformans TaxID=349933 RepID=UPI000489E694|nr:oligopeptide transporter, OPT family [Clostridium hydrogeniformans]
MKKGLPEGAYGLKEGQEKYIPYVPANKVMPEFTALSVVIGIILCIIFGAANAYLGLKIGMTISASIPAAVISMAIVRGVLKRKSILENNIVQTIASAGESLVAGAIFTIPALFLWGEDPSIVTMGIITLVGGVLGVLFMIPIRRYLIVKEHGTLPYPEGVACAEVLVAGEEGGTGAKLVFLGGAIGAGYKFLGDGVKIFPTEIETSIAGFKNATVGMDTLPALLGVGYIIGPRISSYMLVGAILGWLCFIPMISFFGESAGEIIFPAKDLVKNLDAHGIWSNYLKYIGAGAVATGGIISLIKSLPVIFSSFKDVIKGFGTKVEGVIERTDKDLSGKFIIIVLLIAIVSIAVFPQIPVGFIGAILIAIFGFFFVTVSSRIVGLVGSSSNPVSGMTIATLLLTTVILKAMGMSGKEGMIAALCIGAVICTAAAIAGDTSQDLKTGYLVGSTPSKQQLGELIGVVAGACIVGAVMILLNKAYTFGSAELGAPQAGLMKLIIEGIMDGNLPWNLVFMGVGSAIIFEILGVPSLPVAIGLYLPIHLSTPIMVGGLIKGCIDKFVKNEDEKTLANESGVLYASGLIAGEGLMGVILAGLTAGGIEFAFKNPPLGQLGSLICFILLTVSFVIILKKSMKRAEKA